MEHDEIRELLKEKFNDRRKEVKREKSVRMMFDELKAKYLNFGDAEAHLDEMYRILNKKRKINHEGPTNDRV